LSLERLQTVSIAARFENVGKIYPTSWLGKSGITALKGVNLQIPKGSVYGLLGPNRAGKTTLIKLLLGLCRPTEGKITRLDQPASDSRTLARVGYMHENQHFPRYLTATELLYYYGGLSLVPPGKLRTRVPQLLERVGLADRPNEPISRFSKGMVQRLGLAQALLNEPDLLILDEPSEGLDLLGRQMLRDQIADQKKRGVTTVLVSHVLTEVEKTCDSLAVIVGGTLRKEATLANLLSDSGTGRARSLEEALQPIYEAKTP
jgi:ABC-2 type transport system ATP-binding protein